MTVMPIASPKPLDLQYSLPKTGNDKSDITIFPDSTLEDELDFFTSGMAGTGTSSPYIKDEPEDYIFQAHNYPPTQQGHTMHPGQSFNGNNSGHIDPSDLSNSLFGQYTMGSHQNMTGSFNLGNSGINDDELLDLDLDDGSSRHNAHQSQQGFAPQGNMQNYFPTQSQQHMNGQMYSSTPDGAPIQSPFTHGNFNYAQFGQMQPRHMAHASPRLRTNPLNAHARSMDAGYMTSRPRSAMPPSMERQLSDSRSPMTPRTPGLTALNTVTPESGSVPSQPIHTNYNRHRQTQSAQWDNTPGSLASQVDSPISSPGYHHANPAQITEMLKSGKHASLPAKVEHGNTAPAYQTQEAKRRRRRESHNLVERRRRDNINEKIQELSHLVPQHRLEDEKIRKHIQNNSPLSPNLVATGISPPQATSLLAAGGRRATGAGSISMGIPPDDKDKGPNKGDILNGSVSWTRDLMWALHLKLQQESELAEYIQSIGGQFPFEQSEDEKRMRTELYNAMSENDPNSFLYSRGPGSGLRVPNHTNPAGDPLNPMLMGTISPQSLSPGDQGGHRSHDNHQYWDQTFKEEDEYGMEMN